MHVLRLVVMSSPTYILVFWVFFFSPYPLIADISHLIGRDVGFFGLVAFLKIKFT